MVKCKSRIEAHNHNTKIIVKIAVYGISMFSFYFFLTPWARFLERLSQISSKFFSSKSMQLEVTKYC